MIIESARNTLRLHFRLKQKSNSTQSNVPRMLMTQPECALTWKWANGPIVSVSQILCHLYPSSVWHCTSCSPYESKLSFYRNWLYFGTFKSKDKCQSLQQWERVCHSYYYVSSCYVTSLTLSSSEAQAYYASVSSDNMWVSELRFQLFFCFFLTCFKANVCILLLEPQVCLNDHLD